MLFSHESNWRPRPTRACRPGLAVVLVVVGGMLACDHAAAQPAEPDIGIFADMDGTRCAIEQTGPGAGQLFVVCQLGGAAADGIKTAEFGVRGFPEDWIVSVSPTSKALTMLWDPVHGGGTVVFDGCESGASGRIVLATIHYYAPTLASPGTMLTLTRNEHRVDPAFQCPLVKHCEDPPAELRICVAGGDAVLNDSPCPVTLQPTTWSIVKSFYDALMPSGISPAAR